MADDSAWKPPAQPGEPTDPQLDADAPEVVPTEQMAAPSLPDPAGAPTLPSSAPPSSPWAPGGDVPVPPPPPPGSTPVTDAPAPIAPQPHPAPPWASTGPEPSSTAPHTATIEAVTAPERSPRPKWLVAGAVAGVIAVVAAGIFAIVNLTGSTSSGSATPEELGAELLVAIENEDLLGAIDVLVPGERASLGEPFVELVSELQRLEVLAETDLSQISGLDVELSGETVGVRPTNVADIVNIDMRADVVVSIDGEALPIGDLITDNLPDDALTELRGSRATETDELDIWLTAVQQDGRWYFSLLHSAAELARREAVPGVGIPTQGLGAVGAESPEAAVDGLLDRIERLDLSGLIQSLDPDEAAALQRYAPLFIDDAEAALDEVPLDWQITEREVRVDGDGSERTAFLDALEIEGTIEGTAFRVAFRDGCVSASADGESFEQCATSLGDIQDQDVLGIFGDSPEIAELLETIEAAFADIEDTGLELREHDGQWYVSPIGTVTEALLNVFRALDRQELDDIIAAFEPAIGEFERAIEGSINDLAGGGAFVEPEPVFDDDMFLDDKAVAVPSETVPGEPSWFDCYDEADTTDAIMCFESFVATGVIERETIPVVLRHPECGYADISWSNEVYSLPDDEFIAAATAARECFLPLIESGEVSEFELPNEIAYLECFEGRNWYQVFDDPEFDERYYDCIGVDFGD